MAADPSRGGHWPSKTGLLQTESEFAGSSHNVAPSDLSDGPFFTLVDCNNIQVTPLIDADGFIWICGNFRNSFRGVIKLGSSGNEVLRIPVEDQIVATPVLANGSLYLAIDKGVAAAYGLDTGAERWITKYAPGSGNDSWSMGYGQDCLVVAGKSIEAMPWNNSVYGVSASSGSLRWRFEATLMIFFTPCIMREWVFFQDMQCTVTCLRLSDGTTGWQEKFKNPDQKSRLRATSTGQAIVVPSESSVIAAANLPGKKEWNAPYGGQGCVRSFDLLTGKLKWQQDFDLEANTTPAVAPRGADESPLVLVSLGATPGGPIKEAAFGDNWTSRLVALDAASGSQLWAHDFDPWKNYGVRGSNIFQIYTPTSLTNPVVGGDGTVYVGWCGGFVLSLRASDGAVVSRHDLGVAIQASPVIGPGFLVVASYEQVLIWRSWQQDAGAVYEDGHPSVADSSTEHFCPCKGGGNCPGQIPYKAPTDLSRPAWSSELTQRRPHEFYYNSPVIDAQGHIYVTSRYNDMRVLRPDGTLRARIHVGSAATSPALLGDRVYLGTGDGYAVAVDINTLAVVWSRRYCCQANLDAASSVAAEGAVLLQGNASDVRKENKTMYCLNSSDGQTRWTYEVKGVGMVDCRPVIIDVDDLVIFADADGGVYAVTLSDGALLWETNKDQAHYHRGCNICANVSQAQVFTTGALRAEGRWMFPWGGRTVLRCHDAGSGCRRWERLFEEQECTVAPAVALKIPPLNKSLLIVPFGCRPQKPAKITQHGPDGSNCMGDAWLFRLDALDCDNGDLNWSRTMPPLRTNSIPGNTADDAFLPPPFSAPVIGGDGTLYIGCCNGLFLAIEACTGRLLSQYDMGCAAAGSPAIAPGMVCIMSAFRLLVWRDTGMEESWRTLAALDQDPRAAVSQSRAPDNVPEVTHGLLHNVAQGRFDPEGLRAHAWGEEFLKLEPLRRESEKAVINKETCDQHKAGSGPSQLVKAVYQARLGPPLDPKKDGSPSGSPRPTRSAPSTGPAKPAAAQPKGASAAKPGGGGARPAWLQALGDAFAQVDEEEDKTPKRPRWEVIGGGGKGGILARKGQDVNSPQLPSRLATGAIIEEIEVSGDRLSFKKVKGDGPDSGWVSQYFQGKPLLKRL